MKIFTGHGKEGKMVYFEVANTFLLRRTAIKIISEIPDVEIIAIQKREEIFCTFKLGGYIFELWEPFGDNSRYHIGEKNSQFSNELETIKQQFAAYQPWPSSLLAR